jgi:multidrug efflux pump subunit AcrA (membrane-fusion protein)
LKVFQEWRRERQETTRPAVVWLKQGEKLVPRRIRLGLTDEAYSEIAGGILREGDQVVTRVRTERKNARRH